MCNAIGKKVLALHRSRIGNINVKRLEIRRMEVFKKRSNKGANKVDKCAIL